MLSPAEYRRIETERRRLKGEVDRLRREQDEVDRTIRTGERILRILPKKARYRDLMARLESLSSVPLLPQEAFDRRIRAESELRAASEEVARLDKSLSELLGKKESSPVEEALTLLESELEPLEGRRGAVAQSQSELPRRREERERLRQEVARLMEGLGWGEDPSTPSGPSPRGGPAEDDRVPPGEKDEPGLPRRGVAPDALAGGERPRPPAEGNGRSSRPPRSPPDGGPA